MLRMIFLVAVIAHILTDSSQTLSAQQVFSETPTPWASFTEQGRADTSTKLEANRFNSDRNSLNVAWVDPAIECFSARLLYTRGASKPTRR